MIYVKNRLALYAILTYIRRQYIGCLLYLLEKLNTKL